MTDMELTRRLQAALEHTAPDDLDGILSQCGTGTGTMTGMTKAKRRPWRWLAAACLALAVLAGGGGLFYQQAYAVASVISLDVNPSIELRVNRNGTVLACVGLNKDAAVVLADMDGGRDLEGTKLTVAVNALVGGLVRYGYLDNLNAAILISVEDSDAARGQRLRQELADSVDGILRDAAGQVSVLSQSVAADTDLETLAKENNISTGKAQLVEQVMALNGDLAFDRLAKLPVEDLRDMIDAGAPGLPIGWDAALDIILDREGFTADELTRYQVDLALDRDPPYYEVVLRVNTHDLPYRVDAYTGAVISQPVHPWNGSMVEMREAMQIALSDAGCTIKGTASGIISSVDPDGDQSCYTVSFCADDWWYTYKIGLFTGEIISIDREQDPVDGTVGWTVERDE